MADEISSADDKKDFADIDEFYQKLITTQLRNEGTLYIIIGSDNGEFYKQINKYPNPDGTRYLFIELAAEHPGILDSISTQVSQTAFIVSEHEWKKAILLLKVENYIHSEKVTLLKAHNQQKSHEDEYAKLFTDVKNDFSSLVRGLKSQNEQLIYLDKKLHNIVDNILPAQLLAKHGKGTALILGAGPSLDTLLPWIKKHRDQVTLIAVSRIYQQLSYEGIEPDIIVSVDPQTINYQLSKAMLATNKPLFVHSTYVSSQLLAQWNGTSLFLEDPFPWEHKNNKPNLEVGHPTVSHTAVKLAMAMGYDQILLAGIDLCYANTGETHSGGHTTEMRDLDHTILKTYKGESAETSFFMRLGITQMEEVVKGYKGEIYNLSENAAVIKGIEFNDSPVIPESSTPLPQIQKPDNNQRLEHLNMLKRELPKARKKYSEIKKLCKEAIKLNINPAKLNNLDKFEENQVKIDKIEHKFNTSYKDYTELAKQVVSEDFLGLLKQSDRLEKSEEERQRWIGEYYDAYLKGVSLIIDSIENAQVHLAYRLQEIQKNYSINKLIDYWAQIGEIGRSCPLLHELTKTETTLEDKEKLTVICQFHKDHIAFDLKTGEILNLLASKNITDFSDEEKEKIKQVSKSHNVKYKKTILPFQSLLSGFVDQLEGDYKTAMNHFTSLIDELDPNIPEITIYIVRGLLVSTLRRMSEIDVYTAMTQATLLRDKLGGFQINKNKKQHLIDIYSSQINEILPNIFKYHIISFTKDKYKKSDAEEIDKLLKIIVELYPNNKQLIHTKNFIRAIIHQLNGNNIDASHIYTDILENILPNGITKDSDLRAPELESTLLQMLKLSESHQDKINIFYLLSEVSDSYKIELAEALTKAGDFDAAIHCLQELLIKYPDDYKNYSKLGDLYLKIGNQEMATLTFELAKNLSPKNHLS